MSRLLCTLHVPCLLSNEKRVNNAMNILYSDNKIQNNNIQLNI